MEGLEHPLGSLTLFCRERGMTGQIHGSEMSAGPGGKGGLKG